MLQNGTDCKKYNLRHVKEIMGPFLRLAETGKSSAFAPLGAKFGAVSSPQKQLFQKDALQNEILQRVLRIKAFQQTDVHRAALPAAIRR